MCVVSMIGDHYNDKWKQYPWNPYIEQNPTNIDLNNIFTKPISKQEFDALKKEVEEMKALLIKAKIYDEKNNEPNCEMETKVAKLKEIAALLGVDLSEVFK